MEASRFAKTSAEEREKTYKFCSLTYVHYMYCSLIKCINACPNVLSFFQPNNQWICNYAICSYPDYSNNKYTICTMSQLILPRLRISLISACSFNMHANMHQANFLVTQRSDDDFLCETLSLINIKVIFKPFFQTMTLQSLPRNWSKYLMFILLWITHFESVKSKNSFQTNPERA